MSERAVHDFVERLNADPRLRDLARRDPGGALALHGLPSDHLDQMGSDPDALRRLAHSVVNEPLALWGRIKRFLSKVFGCGSPPRTRNWECPRAPGSP